MKENRQRRLLSDSFRTAFSEEFAALAYPETEGHPATDLEFLDRFDNDAVSDEERAAFLEHLDSCIFCRREIAYLVRSGILLADPEPFSEPSQAASQAERALPVSPIATASGGRKKRLLTPTALRILTTAAAVLFVVGVGIMFQSERGRYVIRSNHQPPEVTVTDILTSQPSTPESPADPTPGGVSGSRGGGKRSYLAPEDEPTLVSDIEKAEQGDVTAQVSLGNRYYDGLGVEQDYAEAVKWFRKAAEQGNAEASFYLGRCYAEGNGVNQDDIEAANWFRKAAEWGSAGGQYELGLCYAEGKGVDQNDAEAVNWFRKAADPEEHKRGGNPEAQFSLGLCYAEGRGVEKDSAEAVHWFQESIDQNGPAAEKMFKKAEEEGHVIDPEIISELYKDW